jgi:TetR/AcrR family transcriptional repressor of nem operon
MIYTTTPCNAEIEHPELKLRAARKDQSLSRLIRAGTEMLCEQSYASMGVDRVLLRAGLSKGSFYHFFPTKENFGLQVVAHYAEYFDQKLDRILRHTEVSPLERLRLYIQEGIEGVERFEFRRGCLIGNLSQELGASHPAFRSALERVFQGWQDRVACCLQQAVQAGELSTSADTQGLAEFFWMGWEGALIGVKVRQSSIPIKRFASQFFNVLPRPSQTSRSINA